MQALDILIEDTRWHSLDVSAVAATGMGATLSHLDLNPDICEASILACDDARIAALNAGFRNKSTPTNVLSWPAEERGAAQPGTCPAALQPGPDGMIELGDIALSYDTCASEAQAAGKPITAHVTHLIVHATLHLLGYDHTCDSDGDLMESLEVEILGKLGHDNPYTETAATEAALTRRQD